MWMKFTEVYGDGQVLSVGKKIGGKVQENLELGAKEPALGFTNACAIRMSYTLNHSGISIGGGPWKTVSGADGKQYIYRLSDLRAFLLHTFGRPDKTIKHPRPNSFAQMAGILVFTVHWSDASGHATLWDGRVCSDHCYFPVASEASIWLAK
jgi:hypothetical protein